VEELPALARESALLAIVPSPERLRTDSPFVRLG